MASKVGKVFTKGAWVPTAGGGEAIIASSTEGRRKAGLEKPRGAYEVRVTQMMKVGTRKVAEPVDRVFTSYASSPAAARRQVRATGVRGVIGNTVRLP